MLARGMRIEHLRELLQGIARQLIRHSANLAFAGHWQESDENFTYDLLQWINDERSSESVSGHGAAIGGMYNHLAWPDYLPVTPQLEAQWIHCCRIIRITQPLAGISADSRVGDSLPLPSTDAVTLNSAIVLSAMRRIATEGMTLEIAGMPRDQFPKVPPLTARIFLGGKTTGYRGFLPGLFEEALLGFERSIPMYILGGFGGSACALSEALLAPKGRRTPELELEWHEEHTPQVKQLEALARQRPLPAGVRSSKEALDALQARIDAARRPSLASALKTGLSEEDTIELMTTIDIRRAVSLCVKALLPPVTDAS